MRFGRSGHHRTRTPDSATIACDSIGRECQPDFCGAGRIDWLRRVFEEGGHDGGTHVDLPRTEWPVNGNGTSCAFLRSGVITSTPLGRRRGIESAFEDQHRHVAHRRRARRRLGHPDVPDRALGEESALLGLHAQHAVREPGQGRLRLRQRGRLGGEIGAPRRTRRGRDRRRPVLRTHAGLATRRSSWPQRA